MPRIPRGQLAGQTYHVINRGNARATIFHKDGDYRAFLDLLDAARVKHPVKILGFCLMPNHFHLVVQPSTAEALSHLMQWWLTSHVRRYHRHYHSSGHIWQGRFKSFPIQHDDHLVTALRYVLQNPVRVRLVDRADQWPWSSLRETKMIDPLPTPLPTDWIESLTTPLADSELARLRASVNRQAPFGSPTWQALMAPVLGLLSTLRARGRPRKPQEK